MEDLGFGHCLVANLSMESVREYLIDLARTRTYSQYLDNAKRAEIVSFMRDFTERHNLLITVYHTAVGIFDRFIEVQPTLTASVILTAVAMLFLAGNYYGQAPDMACCIWQDKPGFEEAVHQVVELVQAEKGPTATGIVTAADALFYYIHFTVADQIVDLPAEGAVTVLTSGLKALTAASLDKQYTVHTSAELASGILALLWSEELASTISGLDPWDIIVGRDFIRPFMEEE